jgi:hypothetical protein
LALAKEEKKQQLLEDIEKSKNEIKEKTITTNELENKEAPLQTETIDIKPTVVLELENKNVTTGECNTSISENELNTLIERMTKKADDEARRNFIKKKIETNCFATKQVSNIMATFDTQEGKFLLVKTIFTKIIDKENTAELESSFEFESYKQRLRKFIGKE